MAEMSRADRVAVAAGSDRGGQQVVEVGADVSGLLGTENADPLQVASCVEVVDLITRERPWSLIGGWIESQIAVERRDFVRVGNDFELLHD